MCGNKQLHCVRPRGLIGEGMNLEITELTARSAARRALALCNKTTIFKSFSGLDEGNWGPIEPVKSAANTAGLYPVLRFDCLKQVGSACAG